MKYGLVGKSLSHSYSKAIHGFFGNVEYDLLEIQGDDLDGFMRQADFNGINVTIPYKESVLPYCRLDSVAQKIGSVNTVVNKDGTLYGYNTDYRGLSHMAKSAGITFAGKKVVILGSGGTSKTAACVAGDFNAKEVVVVSRAGENNYENIARHADADILVNTTPVGMFPGNGQTPVSLDVFDRLSSVVDVVYNPLRTRLLLDARERGIVATGGLVMLVAQALCAHNLFFDVEADDDAFDVKVGEVLAKTERLFLNIVLVGMPGCGKTSVGKKLAKNLEMTFVDTDTVIEEKAGRKPGDIIWESGEPFFRKLESEVISQVACGRRQVIATGGGSILAKENRDALLQNGTVIFLDREITALDTRNRPLSHDLQAMHRQRRPIYESFCHHKVKVTGSVHDTVAIVEGVLSGGQFTN